jgi:hypothetical protein
MSALEPDKKYDEEFLKAMFGKSSAEILASGVSVEDYIVHNANKSLKNAAAKKDFLSRLSPARRASDHWEELAIRGYVVMFISFGLLLISAIPVIEHRERVLTDVLRGGALLGTAITCAIAVPALQSYFKYIKLRRQDKQRGKQDPV